MLRLRPLISSPHTATFLMWLNPRPMTLVFMYGCSMLCNSQLLNRVHRFLYVLHGASCVVNYFCEHHLKKKCCVSFLSQHKIGALKRLSCSAFTVSAAPVSSLHILIPKFIYISTKLYFTYHFFSRCCLVV